MFHSGLDSGYSLLTLALQIILSSKYAWCLWGYYPDDRTESKGGQVDFLGGSRRLLPLLLAVSAFPPMTIYLYSG